ncbi:MAG TPA: ABC transporter ATP-binding protein [Candidatus Dormibacteraeota bacterium]
MNGRGQLVLVAEGVARSFQTGARRMGGLRRASLRVAPHELVAVLGRSGSGKSTLLAVCGGLDRPDEGQVRVNGRDLARLGDADRRMLLQREVGWVFQAPLLVPILTAVENVAITMRIAGEREADANNMAMLALEAVGLEERAGRRADELSRGERQRVALARALVKAPSLVIADEPTAQLDSGTAAEILSLLRDAARTEVAVLFSTHDEAEAAQADRVLVMEDGVLRPAG